jgi:hypothetical protein
MVPMVLINSGDIQNSVFTGAAMASTTQNYVDYSARTKEDQKGSR